MKKSLLVLAVFAWAVLPASAAVIFQESFPYADGSLITVSSGTWATSSGTVGQMDVASGKVNLTSTESEDTNRDFTATGSGTLFFGLTSVFSALPTATGSYFAHFWDKETGANTDFFGRLTVRQTPSTSQLLFGIANDTGNTAVYSATEFALGSTIRIVVGFDFSTMTSTLWINPVDVSSPSVVDPVVAVFTGAATTLGGLSLRQATGIGTFTVDDLVVGTTFGDVVAIPEPSTSALLSGAAGMILWTLRRRRTVA